MSFAPKKKEIKSFANNIYSNENQFNEPLMNRLEILESNLNRVCNQHDALMPLLNMNNLMPSLTKTESTLKTLQKKIAENEEKIQKAENALKDHQNYVETSLARISNTKVNHGTQEIQQLDKSIKSTNNHLNALQSNLKDVESTVLNLQKLTDAKFKDEFQSINKSVENKLDRNKNDVQSILAEFKNNIQLTLKKHEELIKNGQKNKFNPDIADEYFERQNELEDKISELQMQRGQNCGIGPDEKERLVDELQVAIQDRLVNYIDGLKSKYEREINTLYREIGILRCEMEMMNETNRKEAIAEGLQNFPKDAEHIERKMKINNLEQSILLHELDRFNKDNTQRLVYEMQSFDESLDNLRGVFAQKNGKISKDEASGLKQEVDFMEDRFMSIKHQMEGTKKKFLYDMKKIEEKMDKVNGLKRQLLQDLNKNSKLKRLSPEEIAVAEAFPEKIKSLMESINRNLEITNKKIEGVEQRLQETKKLIRGYL